MKILIVFGTRPEAIKLFPVINALRKKFVVKICVTAQHREMLDQALVLFNIKPDYDLNIMKQGQDLFDITNSILIQIKSVLNKENPDLVLVHGDTTTSMVTSLAAFYLKIPIGHVEAGLRTKNVYSPFPEEFNRQLVSRIATYHFAPTEIARQNLLAENIKESSIFVTGNTIIDALLSQLDRARNCAFSDTLINNLPFLKSIDLSERIILVTGHRRENFGTRFKNICLALRAIAKANPKVRIVYPVHLNPNIQRPVKDVLSNIDNIFLIKPLEYLEFIKLMDLSYIILTDSGGIQEEAPSLGKPVLLMRDNTERPEAISSGAIKLVGANKKEIVKMVNLLIKDDLLYKEMSDSLNPFGDGRTSELICKILEKGI